MEIEIIEEGEFPTEKTKKYTELRKMVTQLEQGKAIKIAKESITAKAKKVSILNALSRKPPMTNDIVIQEDKNFVYIKKR